MGGVGDVIVAGGIDALNNSDTVFVADFSAGIVWQYRQVCRFDAALRGAGFRRSGPRHH